MLHEIVPSKPLSQLEYRQWVTELEQSVIEQYETFDRHSSITQGFRLEHAFTPGLYVRELTIPAGSLIFSKIHRKTHPFLITQGEAMFYDGNEVLTLKAPHKGITMEGTKRIIYAIQDTVLITFHPTDKTTVEEVDEDGVITCDSYELYERLST